MGSARKERGDSLDGGVCVCGEMAIGVPGPSFGELHREEFWEPVLLRDGGRRRESGELVPGELPSRLNMLGELSLPKKDMVLGDR